MTIPKQVNGTLRIAIASLVCLAIGWGGNAVLSTPSELRAHAQMLGDHKERITTMERVQEKQADALAEFGGDLKAIRAILEKEK